MKVQQISIFSSYNRQIQKANKSVIQQNNNQMLSSDNFSLPVSFGQIKVGYLKKLLKPVTKTLDEKMTTEITKMHISHKAAKKLTPKLELGEYTSTLIQKINANKQRIETLEDYLNTMVKPARVKDAEEKIRFYNEWHDSIQKAYYENKAEAAKKAERDRYIWGFKWCSSGQTKYDEAMEPYWDGHYKYQEIEENLSNLRAIINDHYSTMQAKEDTLATLKRERNSLIAELSSASLGDHIRSSMHQNGSINKRIAGYDDVKQKIENDFVAPLMASAKDDSVKLPNAVVLYGATGVGKTEILRGIEEQCKEVANVVHFPMETTLEDFKKTMVKLLADAKDTYQNQNKKRTIILFDEAEKYISMTSNQAKRYGADFEPDDFDILNQFGNNNAGNVQYMKSLLDWISEKPDGKNMEKSATTLFITTNYPHLIHQDLMKRKGKFLPIAVKPASGSNLKAVIKHYFKKYSDMLEAIKSHSSDANFRESLNGQIGLTEKAKHVLAEKAEKGTISNMYINSELTDWPNWERFQKFTNPSDSKGAYSNIEIKYMIKDAFERYTENPSKPMYQYFFDVKSETKRDITPKRYEKFKNIHNIVSDKVEEEVMDETTKTFSELLKDYTNGNTNDEMSKMVEDKMEKIKKEFSILEEIKKEGGTLSQGEQEQYKLYKSWLEIWE